MKTINEAQFRQLCWDVAAELEAQFPGKQITQDIILDRLMSRVWEYFDINARVFPPHSGERLADKQWSAINEAVFNAGVPNPAGIIQDELFQRFTPDPQPPQD